MEIQILHMIEGARQARGAAVIIDVFRAFTVEAYLMRGGAARVIPVGEKELAYAYKQAHPDAILVGERQGRILPGFDYGNSPSQLEGADLRGRTVIHTTSAGTQGIANAVQADEILTGSLVNAGAIARYLKAREFQQVSLVCMGLNAQARTQEDDLCAEYIKSLLEERPLDMTDRIRDLRRTSGAKFFDPAQQEVFPERDFWLSTELDKFDFVLRLKRSAGGLDEMELVQI